MRPELWVLFAFGLVFLTTRVALAVRFPHPTRDQQAVFRTVLSLSAAGIAAAIPGLFKLDSEIATTTISATGALAVFVLVYLFNPGIVQRAKEPVAGDDVGRTGLDEMPKWASQMSLQLQNVIGRLEVLEKRLSVSQADSDATKPTVPEELPREELELEKLKLEISSLTKKGPGWAALVLGLVLLGLIALYAIFFPQPTLYQVFLFRIVFALAGAGVGATLPSFIEVGSGGARVVLRFSSALLLFLIIYFVVGVSLQ